MRRIVVAALTFWPAVHFGLALAAVAWLWIGIAVDPWQTSDVPFDLLRALVPLQAATFAVIVGMLVFYGVHVARNTALAGGERVAWMLGMFAVAPVVMPVYWWLFVRG